MKFEIYIQFEMTRNIEKIYKIRALFWYLIVRLKHKPIELVNFFFSI